MLALHFAPDRTKFEVGSFLRSGLPRVSVNRFEKAEVARSCRVTRLAEERSEATNSRLRSCSLLTRLEFA
jgi:hypothetical protein